MNRTALIALLAAGLTCAGAGAYALRAASRSETIERHAAGQDLAPAAVEQVALAERAAHLARAAAADPALREDAEHALATFLSAVRREPVVGEDSSGVSTTSLIEEISALQSDANNGSRFTSSVEPLLDDFRIAASEVISARRAGAEAAGTLQAEKLKSAIAALSAVFGTSAVAVFLLFMIERRRMTAGARSLEHAMRAAAQENFSHRVPPLSHGALNRLSAHFNVMAGRLSEKRLARARRIAMVSHDLRTPLTVMKIHASRLERFLRNEEKISEANDAGTLMEEIDRLETLLDDLRESTARDAFPIDRKPCRMDSVLEKALRPFLPEARERGVSLSWKSEVRDEWQADSGRIAQAVRNLVSNALRFTPKEGSINVSAETVGDRVRITVEDTGSGMNPERAKKLFDRPAESDSAGRRGFGASIVAEIARAHGGFATAHSAPGRGTRAVIDLPLHPAAEEAAAAGDQTTGVAGSASI